MAGHWQSTLGFSVPTRPLASRADGERSLAGRPLMASAEGSSCVKFISRGGWLGGLQAIPDRPCCPFDQLFLLVGPAPWILLRPFPDPLCSTSPPPPDPNTNLNMADKNGVPAPLENSSKRQKLDDAPQRTTLQEFESVFPKLEADLVEHAQKYKLPKEELEWYKAVSAPPSPRRPPASATYLERQAQV